MYSKNSFKDRMKRDFGVVLLVAVILFVAWAVKSIIELFC
jgi:hypothetical protein